MPQFGGRQSAGAFFDTDFSGIDSLLAVSLLYGLQGKGDCRVAVITMSRPNLQVAGFADAVQRFYHGPAGNFSELPPIGMRTEGAPGETSAAFTAPLARKRPDGSPVYRNQVRSVIDTADPATLLRNYLEAQHDGGAFLVAGGPASNLAAALAFPGLTALIAAKVKYLVIAGGAFPQGPAQPQVQADLPASRKLFAEWPTPIVAAGAEVGAALPFPGASIDTQFAAAVPDHPVADAYRAYRPMPYDAPTGAMAAALYAARPGAGYFKLSEPGKIEIDDGGRTTFTAMEKGNHQYLIVDPAQTEKIAAAYVELASAKPMVRRFRPPVQNAALPQPRK